MTFPQFVRYTFAGLIAVVMVAGPLGYVLYRKAESRNFRVVRDGVLYRSGQLSVSGLKRLIEDYGIRTVVTLRTARVEGDPHPALDEEEFCRSQELYYHRLQMKSWVRTNGTAPADESVRAFLDIMKNPANHPVLVHCFAGKHRTGAYCAIYRMEFENWSNEQAIEEMILNGYDDLEEHEDLDGYLNAYRPMSRSTADHAECCPPCKPR
jgi:protein tyrosine/serine phosphatase